MMGQGSMALGVAVGAIFGALLRWGVGLWLNPVWAGFPVGTMAVNWVGGLLAGVAYVVLGRHPNDAWRAVAVIGFLGGLTTFSSFSAESLALIERDRWLMAMLHTLAHVLGALFCAILGARLARIWVS